MVIPKSTLSSYSFSQHYLDNHTKDKSRSNAYLESVRIVQKNLVFVSGLPCKISDPQVLKSSDFFGRYGKVTKLIVNPQLPLKKPYNYQAYVTYQEGLDTALAITALNGYDCQEKILKVSFGTTKYCSHFLKGYQCLNQQCFYLHQYDHKNQVLNKQTKIIFAEQNQSAFQIVCDHIDQVVKRAINQEKQKHHLIGFPSLMELLDFLVQTNWIGQSDLKSLIAKYTPKQPKAPQKKVKTQKKTIVSSQNSIKQNSLASKMTKTTLLSTAIPIFKTQPFPQTHKHIQKNQQKNLKPQKNPQKIHKQPQNIKSPQIKRDNNENQMQNLIQKTLLKQLSKENEKSKSKMQFRVDHKVQQNEKIRKIIKKFMIIL